MFLALWNYLHGYVIILVTGFSVERFVNLAAHRGIYIWDVRPEGPGVTMKVSVNGFWQLREAARKTKCRIKIVGKQGLPFRINHYRKRKIMAAGLLLFVVALYALSSFIWVVTIEGNERIASQDILQFCQEQGLSAGKLKFGLDTKKVSDSLLDRFSDISWVSVQLTGTSAKIKIVETIPKTEIVDRTTPCDIISKKNGVIVSMATSAGTPLVKADDVVEEGEVLVSGEVVIKDVDTEVGREYVRAQSKVLAKVWYTLEEQIELRYDEKVYLPETKSDLSLNITDKIINFVKPNLEGQQYDEVTLYDKNLAIGDYQFPISIVKKEYQFYTLVERTRTQEEAEAILREKLNGAAKALLTSDAEIVENNITFTKDADMLKGKAEIVMIERIDQERPLDAPQAADPSTGGQE